MPHNYYEDVKNAEISPIREIIFQKFPPEEAEFKLATFDEDYRRGVDLWWGGLGIQVKQRRTYYAYDMAVESHHEYVSGRIEKGWAHKESDALWLFYYWHNCFKNKKCTVALVMQMPNLLTVVKNNYMNWGDPVKNKTPTDRDDSEYYTYNHMVPVKELRRIGVFIAHMDVPFKRERVE